MNKIKDLKIITPEKFSDRRGFFAETYSRDLYYSLGVKTDFVQDNHSISRDVVRFAAAFPSPPHAQAGLVRWSRRYI